VPNFFKSAHSPSGGRQAFGPSPTGAVSQYRPQPATAVLPSHTVSDPAGPYRANPSAPLSAFWSASPTAGVAPLRVHFSATASGGTPPYNYVWHYGDGSQDSGPSAGNITHIYNFAGKYVATLWVNDSANATFTANLSVVAESKVLVVTPVVATPSNTDVGKAATFNVSVSGGSGVYNLTWQGLPPGCLTQNSTTLTCTPTSVNSYSIDVWAVDQYHYGNTSTPTDFGVFNPPTLGRPSAVPPEIDLGQNATLSTSEAGGAPPLRLAWLGLPNGCTSSSSASLTCQPATTGTYPVRAMVTDAAGVIANSPMLTLRIFPALTTGPPSSSPAFGDVGSTSTIGYHPSGGTGNYSFIWTSAGAGCAGSTSASISCIPTKMGNFTVKFEMTDNATGAAANSSFQLSVNPALVASLAASPTSVSTGSELSLNVSVHGGTHPYSLTYSGLPGGCSTQNTLTLTCTPSSSGEYQITVSVQDGASVRATASVEVNVTQAAGSPGLNPLILPAAAVLILVVAAAVILYSRVRRRKLEQVH
jgi:hypothetical protein